MRILQSIWMVSDFFASLKQYDNIVLIKYTKSHDQMILVNTHLAFMLLNDPLNTSKSFVLE